jgi:polyphosphate kinase
MPRNLERRVEAIFPIKNPTVHEQILCQIMAANLRDEAHSWVLDSNGKYIRFADTHGYQNFFSCHQFFMSCPSLSGRGSAQDGLNKKTRNMYKKNQYPDYSKKYDEENL